MVEASGHSPARTFGELLDRLGDSNADIPTLHRLLEAVLVVGSGLDLDLTLQRIITSATTVLDCRYGALGGVAAPGGAGSRNSCTRESPGPNARPWDISPPKVMACWVF